jgi:hypothetical protein
MASHDVIFIPSWIMIDLGIPVICQFDRFSVGAAVAVA